MRAWSGCGGCHGLRGRRALSRWEMAMVHTPQMSQLR